MASHTMSSSAKFFGAEAYESYDAYEAQMSNGHQCFWSSADQSAFHNYGYGYSDYSNYAEVQMTPSQYYQSYHAQSTPCQTGLDLSDYSDFSDADAAPAAAPVQCAVNLSDYEDDSDSDSDSNDEVSSPVASSPGTPLSKARSVDDMASTDAASTDAASNATGSDASDSDEPSTPKSKSFAYTRDALLLLRVAVGMCAKPDVCWKSQAMENFTVSREAAPTIKGDGTEWRRAAADRKQSADAAASTKLSASAESWGAQQALRRSALNTSPSDEEVLRSIKSILNKLTVEKFEDLYLKLMSCGISTTEHIELLVNEVFDKACMQHHFVDMYADLCMRLEKSLAVGSGAVATTDGFRRILLSQCQSSFEQSLKPAAAADADDDEEAKLEAAILHKRRVLGNMRLIGALLVRRMLSPKILISCAEQLLDPSAPEALESLAVLMTTVGPSFDTPSWSCHAPLCSIFDRMKAMTKDKGVPPRMRFLISDVLDLRSASWVNTKACTKKSEGPMKIEEVHRQAAQEAEQKPAQGGSKAGSKNSGKALKDLKGVCEAQKSDSRKQKSASTSVEVVKSSKNASGTSVPATSTKGATKATAASSSGKAQQTWKKVPHCPPPATPPCVAAAAPASSSSPTFSLASFHRELSDVMRELSSSRSTVSAVRRMQAYQIPKEHQATEFTNILARIAEERSGAARRAMFAFAASLTNGTFEHDSCTKGIKAFFEEDYEDLCEEVPRLPEILKAELIPTLRAALSSEILNKLLPPAML